MEKMISVRLKSEYGPFLRITGSGTDFVLNGGESVQVTEKFYSDQLKNFVDVISESQTKPVSEFQEKSVAFGVLELKKKRY